MHPALARALISAQFPQLASGEVTYLAEGCDSTAFEVNQEWVFRFPKRAEVDEQLLIETRMLDLLGVDAPVPVPAFTYRGLPSGEFPFHFAGYRKLPGVEAIRLDAADVPFDALAAPLGRFLGWLHSFPLEEARIHGIQARDGSNVLAEYRVEASECLARASGVAAPGELARWRDFLESAPFSFGVPAAPVVLHSDFYQEHILLDPASRTLSGIIDWGDVELGDPALDIAGLFSWGGAAFARAALDHYTLPMDDGLFERARFLAACRSAVDLKHGIELQRAEYLEAGRRGLAFASNPDFQQR